MITEKELKPLITTLDRIATALERIASGVEPASTSTVHVITTDPADVTEDAQQVHPPEVTLDSLRPRFQRLGMGGFKDDLLTILAEHDAKKLPDLAPQHFEAVAKQLSVLEEKANHDG